MRTMARHSILLVVLCVLAGCLVIPAPGKARGATGAAPVSRCYTNQLWISRDAGNSGAGHVGVYFRLHNHAHETWACDVLQVNGRWVRSLVAFFVLELGSRTVVHVGVTQHPTDEWIHRFPAHLEGSPPRLSLRGMTHRTRLVWRRMNEVASTGTPDGRRGRSSPILVRPLV